MTNEKQDAFTEKLEASGEYLLCFTFAQFGAQLENGAGDSTGLKWMGKSFGMVPGIIIGSVKEIKKGSSLKDALIEIGIDVGIDLLLGQAAPLMVVSRIAHSASECTEEYLLSFEEIHNHYENIGCTSDASERQDEQGLLNAMSLPSKAIELLKGLFKDKPNEVVHTTMSYQAGQLPAGNPEEIHSNFSKLVAIAWNELFMDPGNKDKFNKQAFTNKDDLYSYLGSLKLSEKFNNLPSSEEVSVEPKSQPDTKKPSADVEITQFNTQRDLAKEALEKKRIELLSPCFESTKKISQIGKDKMKELTTLRSGLDEKASIYKKELADKWEKYDEYVSGHRKEEQKYQEKHPKNQKGYEKLCESNRDKEEKRAAHIKKEYGGPPGSAAVILADNDHPARNFSAGTQWYKMLNEYDHQKQALNQKYETLIEEEKAASKELDRIFDEIYGAAKAQYIKEWGDEGSCYDKDENGEYINQSERAIALRNKYPEEKSILKVFGKCINLEGLSSSLLSSLSAAYKDHGEESDSQLLTTHVKQLDTLFQSISEKMQIAAKRYQSGEIGEEEYIATHQQCKAETEKFFAVAEDIEPNTLLTEQFKAELQQRKNTLSSCHDLIIQDIISKKLHSVVSLMHAGNKNHSDLLLLFTEIDQRWQSLEQKSAHANLMLQKGELAFQLKEYDIAAESYMQVLHSIQGESQELISQLQTLISLCQHLHDGVQLDDNLRAVYDELQKKGEIVSKIKSKLAEKQEEYRLRLENIGFIQLALDLSIKLFDKYDAEKAPEKALDAPYKEVIHSVAAVANQVAAVAKHSTGEILGSLNNPSYTTIQSLVGELSPEDEKLVRDLFNTELNAEAAKNNYKNFFTQYGGTILYFKLTTAIFELGLQSCYAKYFHKAKGTGNKKVLSYEEWLREHVWSNTTSILSGSKVVLDAFSKAQMANQFSDLLQKGMSLNSTREILVLMMNFPHLSHYINEYTCLPGQKVSTDAYAVFTSCLLENMNQSIFQQILNVHDETVLCAVVRVLQKFEFSLSIASWTSVHFKLIQGAVFLARLTYHAFVAHSQMYDKTLERRIENINNYVQILECANVNLEPKALQSRTALLYEHIKYAAFSLSDDHPLRSKLYITALYKQHQLKGSFAVVATKGSMSESIFHAVATYTTESARALNTLVASEKNKPTGKPENYPQEFLINRLAKIIKRPICVVEGEAATRVYCSDSPIWDFENFKILKTDPIFILYDSTTKKYHGLLTRGELYFELHLKKKLARQERAHESKGETQPTPIELHARLDSLRHRMFQRGLIPTLKSKSDNPSEPVIVNTSFSLGQTSD